MNRSELVVNERTVERFQRDFTDEQLFEKLEYYQAEVIRLQQVIEDRVEGKRRLSIGDYDMEYDDPASIQIAYDETFSSLYTELTVKDNLLSDEERESAATEFREGQEALQSERARRNIYRVQGQLEQSKLCVNSIRKVLATRDSAIQVSSPSAISTIENSTIAELGSVRQSIREYFEDIDDTLSNSLTIADGIKANEQYAELVGRKG